jgi:hypothetical protein
MIKILRLAGFLLCSLGFGLRAQAVLPQLDPDPQILSEIETLGDNQGTFLPAFTCVDVYGGEGLATHSTFADKGPGIRDYCNKWVYVDSRQRGAYCGGNHGVPHKFNDVWEYDLASNTWIMLHKPDPGVITPHTWWGMTYDQRAEKIYWVTGIDNPNNNFMVWESMNWTNSVGVLYYDPYAQNGWHSLYGDGQSYTRTASVLEYIGSRDITIFYNKYTARGCGMHTYDSKTDTWSELLSGSYIYHTCTTCPGSEALVNYDPRHDILVGFRADKVYHYNFTDTAWSQVHTGPIDAHDARSALTYDTDNGIHLLYNRDDSSLYAYEAGTMTLTRLNPSGDYLRTTRQVMAFYHKDLNVAVFYKDNSPNIWLYRYKESTGTESQTNGQSLPALTLNLTPNPMNSRASIKFSVTGSGGLAYLCIYDPQGRLQAKVTTKVIGPGYCHSLELNSQQLPGRSGLYLVRLIYNGRSIQKKYAFIK